MEKLILLKGIFFFFTATLYIKFLPIKYYLILLHLKPKFTLSNELIDSTIHLIKKTIKRIDAISPWKNSCFVKSLVFRRLVTHYGIEGKIVLGLNIDGNLLNAHAYVKITNYGNYLKIENLREVVTF